MRTVEKILDQLNAFGMFICFVPVEQYENESGNKMKAIRWIETYLSRHYEIEATEHRDGGDLYGMTFRIIDPVKIKEPLKVSM